MAKYTREQRQRAVELYVKYECCAADVIRELGYPMCFSKLASAL